MSQQALAQTYSSSNGTTAASAALAVSATNTTVTASPSQSTSKEFWINTVHLDRATNLHAPPPCITWSQNITQHPAEMPPASSTIPTDEGFRITEPNKVRAWDLRSFTFAPDQIVVNHSPFQTSTRSTSSHNRRCSRSFSLLRGQIHTSSFIANNPGTINFYCHIHMPNMSGQLLVLPKSV